MVVQPAAMTDAEQDELREITADHEAGHAVMRWLRGLPATDLYADVGFGYCAGTGAIVSAEDTILIQLAGYAVESGYGLLVEDAALVTAETADFIHAKAVLAAHDYCRFDPASAIDGTIKILSVDEAFLLWFRRCCEMLVHFADIVEHLGCELFAAVFLSAAKVEELLSLYDDER